VAIEGEFTDVEWGPDPIARTNAEFSFSLASTTTIRIQGDIQVAPQADPWESWVYVWFAGVLGHRIGSIVGGGPGPAIFFDEIVTLPAGTYSFFVDAAAQGYFPGPAASWNVLITVPEPALLPVFALLALWMRRARSSV